MRVIFSDERQSRRPQMSAAQRATRRRRLLEAPAGATLFRGPAQSRTGKKRVTRPRDFHHGLLKQLDVDSEGPSILCSKI